MEEPWIKLEVGIFGDRKIKRIRRDEGNDFVLIWIMLLVLAGQCNDRGRISVTEDSPFSPEELAEELGFKESVINRAVTKFQELKMVDVDEEGFLFITNWCKHQNVEGMEKLKKSEQRKEANQRYYQKRKALLTESIVEALPEHQTEEEIKTSYKTPIKTSYKISEKSYSVATDKDIDKENKNKKKNKNIYGSFSNVLLTEDEFIRLGKDYGEETRDRAIEYLSSYIKEKHYKSAEHNLSIRRWVMDAISKERRTNSGFKTDIRVKQESTDDNERFYSTYSPEECDRLLAEYEAQGY